jgi:hypothetical protein
MGFAYPAIRRRKRPPAPIVATDPASRARRFVAHHAAHGPGT